MTFPPGEMPVYVLTQFFLVCFGIILHFKWRLNTAVASNVAYSNVFSIELHDSLLKEDEGDFDLKINWMLLLNDNDLPVHIKHLTRAVTAIIQIWI